MTSKELMWIRNCHYEMHSNAYKLLVKFKMALYSSALIMKLLTIVESCFEPKLVYNCKAED